MRRLQLTPAEIDLVLTRGEDAALLMQNAAFLNVIDDISNFHLSALVAAPPGASSLEAREYHHTMHTAIREVAQEIQSRVAYAEELKLHIEQAIEANEEDDINE